MELSISTPSSFETIGGGDWVGLMRTVVVVSLVVNKVYIEISDEPSTPKTRFKNVLIFPRGNFDPRKILFLSFFYSFISSIFISIIYFFVFFIRVFKLNPFS